MKSGPACAIPSMPAACTTTGRVADHPGRPMVMVIGSSRAMGVCPAAWEDVRGGRKPMLFNIVCSAAGR